MSLNPGWAAILGIIVWALGLAYKYVEWRPGWEPDSKRMVAVITGLAVLLGVGQCVYEALLTPIPTLPATLPDLVFVWIPNVAAWVALTIGTVFSVSQGVYVLIRKVIFGRA